jgi:small GTP-binding protein
MARMRPEFRREKVVFLGPAYVGKSHLINAYRQMSSADLQPTIGAEMHEICVPFLRCRLTLNVWDTGGEERYSPLQTMYYRHARCGVLVFSLTDSRSLEDMEAFYRAAVDAGVEHFIVAANKADLPPEVEWADAKQWCGQRRLRLIKTSAVTGANVTNLFQGIAEIVTAQQPDVVHGIEIGEAHEIRANRDCCS